MTGKKLLIYVVGLLFGGLITACGVSLEDNASIMTADELKKGASMQITSDSLKDGVWADVITNTEYGKNASPAISFEAVENADHYAVYFVDESADNWLHWKAFNLKKTDFDEGGEIDSEISSYIGPYPPSGTHKYVLYVFALKGKPDKGYPGDFNKAGMGIGEIYEKYLDVAEGKSGNVISYGYIEGTYTAKTSGD